MLLEFHVTAAKLRAILLSRLRVQKVCVTDEFTALGEVHFLDHVEFLDTATFERSPATATIHVPNAADAQIASTLVRYVQPVVLYATMFSTLEASNAAPSTPDRAPMINLLFDLTMRVQAGVPRFRITLDSVKADLLDALAPGTSDKIESKLDVEFETDMDISAIGALVGTTTSATNAGMVVDQAGTRVTMRVEVNGSGNSVPAWSSFFNGPVPDLLSSNDWSVLIDKDLIVPVVVSRVAGGIQDAPSFSLDSGPSGAWSFAFGPRVVVSFSGEAIDACTCLWGEIDVDVDVTMTATLSVPQNNTLRMNCTIEHDANDAEVFCCAMTAAQFWPIVGALMLDKGIVDWGQLFGGILLGPLAVFIGTVVMAANQTPDFDAPESCTKISDEELQCDQPVNISAGLGTLTLTGIVGLPQGPLLSGTLFTGTSFGVGVLGTEVSPFSWGITGSCNSGFHPSQSAGVLLTNNGSAPIGVCECSVIEDSDPQDVYLADLSDGGQQPSWVVGFVTIGANMTDEFLAAPYPCKLKIKSSGGARIITLAPPTSISDEEMQALQMQALLAKVNCYSAVDPFWGATGKFNPKWHVDPPPDGFVEHLWDVFIGGLQPGERVQAVDALGEARAAVTADRRGVARLTAVVAPATGGAELALVRVAAGDKGSPISAFSHAHVEASAETRRVLIKEVTLIRRATLPLFGQCSQLSSGRMGGIPSVIAVTENGVRVFDVRTPRVARLAQTVVARGIRGAALWLDRLVVWGEQGIALLAPSESRIGFPAGGHRFERGVQDAASVGNLLRVHTVEEIMWLAPDLSPVSLPPVEVTLLRDTAEQRRPTDEQRAAAPWLADATRVGRVIARIDPGARTVGVYEVARTYDA